MRTVKTAGETAQAAMAATDTGARAPGATESNYTRKWREAHKEKIAAYARIYRASHPLLMKWKGMLMRTGLTSDTTPGNIKHYIDRGIAVCDEWRLFKNFESWAMANGWKPGLEIDRIDNNGNYEPGNCRFVSRVENIRNRRNTVRVFYNGRIMPLAEAFEMSGCKLSYRLVLKRVTQGKWPVEKALTLPARFMRRMDRHSDATAKNEDGGMSGATFLVYALRNGAFKACASYSAFARAKGYADELAAFVEKRGLAYRADCAVLHGQQERGRGMISRNTYEDAENGRVVSIAIVDGGEYRRLKAFAECLNADSRFEDDNTAATIFHEFFVCDCDLDAKDTRDAAAQVADGVMDLSPYEPVRRLQDDLCKAVDSDIVTGTGEA